MLSHEDRQSLDQSPRGSAVTMAIIDMDNPSKRGTVPVVPIIVISILSLTAVLGLVMVGRVGTRKPDVSPDWTPDFARKTRPTTSEMTESEMYFSPYEESVLIAELRTLAYGRRLAGKKKNGKQVMWFSNAWRVLKAFMQYREKGVFVDAVRDAGFHKTLLKLTPGITSDVFRNRTELNKFFKEVPRWDIGHDKKLWDDINAKYPKEKLQYTYEVMSVLGRQDEFDASVMEKCIRKLAARALERSQGDDDLCRKYRNTWGLYLEIIESDSSKEISYENLKWLRVLQDKFLMRELDFVWEIEPEGSNDNEENGLGVVFAGDALFWIESQVVCTDAAAPWN